MTKHTIVSENSHAEERVTYSVGDVFRMIESEFYYVIVRSDQGRVQLIHLQTFNCWSDSVLVINSHLITEEEFSKIVTEHYRNSFVRVKEVQYKFIN